MVFFVFCGKQLSLLLLGGNILYRNIFGVSNFGNLDDKPTVYYGVNQCLINPVFLTHFRNKAYQNFQGEPQN